MTRSRLYVLLDAFEADMRAALLRYVLDHLDEEAALGPNYEKANLRRESDGVGDAQSVVQFLDMREAYDVLNRHRASLPEELGKELRENTDSMNLLVPIRNRVMHGRPLQAGDPENAVTLCRQFNTRFWLNMRETLDHLVRDPAWEPAFEGHPSRADRILHNLPLPEYDETGLIGRSDDCDKIVAHLMRRREPIITLTGEGGIGKTATALEVAYRLVDDFDSPYECILWVSLKRERLTTQGVEEILSSARDLTGAARRLGQAFDEEFHGGINELAEILDGIETLLIIDNLETVNGSEVVTLYETLPDNVTYLFTSRIGVGQFERRIALGPLKDKFAVQLFRDFAKSRDISRLVRWSQPTILDVVRQLRYSPLAIRWYVLSVESGHEPKIALENQEELLDFCVASVYGSMTAVTQGVLQVLYAIERDATFEELVVVSDLPLDSLRAAIHELLNGSMVRLESDTDSALISRVSLTDAARSYLQRVNPPAAEAVALTLLREEEFRRGAERRRMDEEDRQLSPNVVRIRSQLDEPVAHILRKALLESKEGHTEAAQTLIEKARSMSPDFWEVDRVQGFILSQRSQVEAASSAYLSALRKADEQGKAVISYYFAGHLARKAHEVDKAIEYARKAHDFFNVPESAQTLGTLLVWARRYEEGQNYLEWALERSKGRLRLITLTSLVESWRRWAEYLLDHERRPLEAAEKAGAGFFIGYQEIQQGTHDSRLTDNVLECAVTYMRCITKSGPDASTVDRQTIRILKRCAAHLYTFERCRTWQHFPGWIGQLRRGARSAEVVTICEQILQFANPDMINPIEIPDEVLFGTICQWKGTFGFISHGDFPQNVFFPASALEGVGILRDPSLDLQGVGVRFIPKRDDRGRDRADWVQVVGSATSSESP